MMNEHEYKQKLNRLLECMDDHIQYDVVFPVSRNHAQRNKKDVKNYLVNGILVDPEVLLARMHICNQIWKQVLVR